MKTAGLTLLIVGICILAFSFGHGSEWNYRTKLSNEELTRDNVELVICTTHAHGIVAGARLIGWIEMTIGAALFVTALVRAKLQKEQRKYDATEPTDK